MSAFGVQTGANVDVTADYIPTNDASVADASKNKIITVQELGTALTTPGATKADLFSEHKATGTLVTKKFESLTTGVAASATQTILDYTGVGYVSSLFIASGNADLGNWPLGNVNIYIDGSGTPDISMPMLQFFQTNYMHGTASAPNKRFSNRFFGANVDGSTNINFYTTLPIPFATRVKIDMVNGSSTTATTMQTIATIQSGVANTWSRTRRLKATTQLLNAPAADTSETLLNILGKGRLVGMWMMQDDFPNSLTPKGAAWEGNFRFYIDTATKVWAAGTSFVNGNIVIDSNGHKQTVTTGGTSGGSAPSWSQVSGATTADNTVVWTQTPGTPNNTWLVSRPFALNMSILDSNGWVQRVTTAGTSAGSIPSFNVTPGGTTTDNTVTWTNQGSTFALAAYQSTGTEDYFMQGNYGIGMEAMYSSNGYAGTGFCNSTPMVSSTETRAFYRFHVHDPITFDTSLAILWPVGDTSQKSYTGTPKIWVTVYYYTEA